MDQVPELALPDELGINKVKSFEDCVFKFNIPQITRLDDCIEITSLLTFRVSDPSIELALYKGIFIDKLFINLKICTHEEITFSNVCNFCLSNC